MLGSQLLGQPLDHPECVDAPFPIESEYLVYADVTGDGNIDVLDVIQMVNIVLGNIVADEWQECASDSNGDGNIDVLDVIQAVQFILNS